MLTGDGRRRAIGGSNRLPGSASPDAPYWAVDAATLAERLGSGLEGLTSAQAAAYLRAHGGNVIRKGHQFSRLSVLGRQLRSPLLLLLLFAAVAAVLTGEWLDAAMVL